MTDASEAARASAYRYLVRNAMLSSGKPAWPLAESNGISRAAFKQRLVRGVPPDEAATVPMLERDNGGPKAARGRTGAKPVYLTSGGKPGLDAALAAGVTRVTFYARMRRGWSVDQAAGLAPPLRSTGRPVAS